MQEYMAITILLEPRTIGMAQVLFNLVSLALWLDSAFQILRTEWLPVSL